MLKRVLSAALVATCLWAAPAAAQSEYDGAAGSTEVLADGRVRVTGEGCAANAGITYSATKDGVAFHSGTAQADENGNYSFTYMSAGAGRYETTVDCGGTTAVLGATLEADDGGGAASGGSGAAGTDPSPAPGLAFTGGTSNSSSIVRVGALLLILGGVGVYAAKRRKVKTSA